MIGNDQISEGINHYRAGVLHAPLIFVKRIPKRLRRLKMTYRPPSETIGVRAAHVGVWLASRRSSSPHPPETTLGCRAGPRQGRTPEQVIGKGEGVELANAEVSGHPGDGTT